MGEALGPYRAALTQGRRRTVIFLLALLIALFGAIAWTSHRPLHSQRKFLSSLEKGKFDPQILFRFGISCFGGDEFGGPQPTQTDGASSGQTPAEKPIPGRGSLSCQFIGPDGTPIGPAFQEDPFRGPKGPSLSPEVLRELTPALLADQRRVVNESKRQLAPRRLFESRVRALGTFLGIGLALLLAATLFGAEVRWGVWRTLLTHEPRRGRLLLSKLAALWTFVAVGLAVGLGVATGVDVVMRTISNVHASGGPSYWHLAEQTGWAALSLELYATIAAALALSIRTSIAGAAALLLALGDHLAVQKYVWLRDYSPVQQVASLLPQPGGIASGYAWFPRVLAKVTCTRPTGADTFPTCTETMLKSIPHWRASLVIGGWLIAFALAAWGLFRARDVPQ